MAHQIEMLSWGDAGIYLCTPRGGLGSAAVEAAGTPEQKKKFLSMLDGEKPVLTAMAITEADAGSDNSAIICRAVLDEETNEWVLNGEKIFIGLVPSATSPSSSPPPIPPAGAGGFAPFSSAPRMRASNAGPRNARWVFAPPRPARCA